MRTILQTAAVIGLLGLGACSDGDTVTSPGSPSQGTSGSDFSLSVAPNPLTVPAESDGFVTITVTRVGSFTLPVPITIEPSNSNLSCGPISFTIGILPSTATVSCSSMTPGTYTVIILGTNTTGGAGAGITLTLIVT